MKKWLETDSFEEAFEKYNENVDEIEQGFYNRYTKQEVDDELNTKADKLDTYTKQEVDTSLELKANKQQEAWITPTLLNGASFDVNNPFRYRKNQMGVVECKGKINVLDGNAILTFPTGYRTGTTNIQRYPIIKESPNVLTFIGVQNGTLFGTAGLLDFSAVRFIAEG